MLFGFIPAKVTIDDVFILRMLQEQYCAKEKKLYVYVEQKKTFDRVPREVVEWAKRKKGIPEALVR